MFSYVSHVIFFNIIVLIPYHLFIDVNQYPMNWCQSMMKSCKKPSKNRQKTNYKRASNSNFVTSMRLHGTTPCGRMVQRRHCPRISVIGHATACMGQCNSSQLFYLFCTQFLLMLNNIQQIA